MAISQKTHWDDAGTEPGAGLAKYAVNEQPIANWDNWFNKATVDDIAAIIAAFESHNHLLEDLKPLSALFGVGQDVLLTATATTLEIKNAADNAYQSFRASKLYAEDYLYVDEIRDNGAGNITFADLVIFDAHLNADIISEKTAATGVTVDSCLIKDGVAVPASHGADKHTNITRKVFIPATEGYTTGDVEKYGFWNTVALDPDTLQEIDVSFKIPEDYESGGTIKFLYIAGSASANNVIWHGKLYHAADGEHYQSNYSSDNTNTRAIETDAQLHEVTTTLELTSPAKGDYVSLTLIRAAAEGTDNYILDWRILGFVFEYTAEQ